MQKLTRSLAMAGALAFAGVLAGCGDDVTVSTPTTVTVTPGNASLRVGESVTLTAAVTGDVADKTVTWSSSDQAKATVDGNGKVTAVAIGSATITATSNADGDAKASALITVTGSGVNQVTVSPSNAIIKPGDFLQASAQVDADPGVARTVTWTSSNQAVATVDNTGKVTAVTDGTASITAASTVDPSVSGSLAL
ncbi:MAG TPA: Ig-like domain-containing protein, partial [Gemmatimonadaceae bacterium]|nr:Ig-like domain-containing protein [Gemmatimonadaceae bacterium]